jgi:hypothetical protein
VGTGTNYFRSLSSVICAFICSLLYHFCTPLLFFRFSTPDKAQVILIVLLNAVFFPFDFGFVIKRVGFIQSVFLHNQKDRIIPYMACSIFFFWTYHVFREQHQYPIVLTAFFFGVLLSALQL